MSAPLPDEEEIGTFEALTAYRRDHPKRAAVSEAIFAVVMAIGAVMFALRLVSAFF